MSYFPSTQAWRLTFLLALVVAVLFLHTGLTLDPFSLVAMAVLAGPCLIVAIFYQYRRPDPIVHAAMTSLAFIVIYSWIGAGFSYACIALAFPLRDTWFAAIDQALGFSWLGLLELLSGHKWILDALDWSYNSAFAQILIATILLSFFDRDRLRVFLHSYATTGFLCILIATPLPLMAAYHFYQPPPHLLTNFIDPEAGRWHLEVFSGLRDGSFTHVKLHQTEGIITFPSFHTCVGAILIYAYWGFRWLRFPILGVNVLMILSTIPIGGHYLADPLAGLMIATTTIWLFRRKQIAPPPKAT